MIKRFKRAFGKIQDKVIATVNSGSSVYCTMCGWKGRYFKEDELCPFCRARSRHRLMPYCARVFGIDFNHKGLLHIGPNIEEVDWILGRFTPHPYYRCDINPRGLVNLCCDARSIPLPDECVDYALSWHVLEHIPEDREVIREVYRVLCAGGRFLVSVPITPVGRMETFENPDLPRERYLEVHGHHDHVRSCGLDYSERFREAGFTVETLRVEDGVEASEKALFGLSDRHVVWCCAKPFQPKS